MQVLYWKKAVIQSWKIKNDHGKIMEFQFWKLVGTLLKFQATYFFSYSGPLKILGDGQQNIAKAGAMGVMNLALSISSWEQIQ